MKKKAFYDMTDSASPSTVNFVDDSGIGRISRRLEFHPGAPKPKKLPSEVGEFRNALLKCPTLDTAALLARAGVFRDGLPCIPCIAAIAAASSPPQTAGDGALCEKCSGSVDSRIVDARVEWLRHTAAGRRYVDAINSKIDLDDADVVEPPVPEVVPPNTTTPNASKGGGGGGIMNWLFPSSWR